MCKCKNIKKIFTNSSQTISTFKLKYSSTYFGNPITFHDLFSDCENQSVLIKWVNIVLMEYRKAF